MFIMKIVVIKILHNYQQIIPREGEADVAYLGDQSLSFFLYLYILIVNCFLKKKQQNASKQQCILNSIST